MRWKMLRLTLAVLALAAASARPAQARTDCPGPIYVEPNPPYGSCLALGGPDCEHCKYDCEGGRFTFDMCES